MEEPREEEPHEEQQQHQHEDQQQQHHRQPSPPPPDQPGGSGWHGETSSFVFEQPSAPFQRGPAPGLSFLGTYIIFFVN